MPFFFFFSRISSFVNCSWKEGTNSADVDSSLPGWELGDRLQFGPLTNPDSNNSPL